MQILRAYRIGVRGTHEEVSEKCIKCVTYLFHRHRSNLRLGLRIVGQHRLVRPHLLGTIGHDVVAPLPVGAHAAISRLNDLLHLPLGGGNGRRPFCASCPPLCDLIYGTRVTRD